MLDLPPRNPPAVAALLASAPARAAWASAAPRAPGLLAAPLGKPLRLPLPSPLRSWMQPSTKSGCLYLADNIGGNVNVYSSSAPFALTGTLSSVVFYGWGVAVTQRSVFLGTWDDTIDVFTPCTGSVPSNTLRGRKQGYPYGITAESSGSVWASEWPTSLIDFFDPTGALKFQKAEPNIATVYGLAWDPKTKGAKSEGRLFVSGYNRSFSSGIVDACKPDLSSCQTLNGIATGFPGGIAVDNSPDDLLYVDDQDGTLTSYTCTDPPSNACTATAAFTYANGTNPLDYTTIALATTEVNGTAQNVWAANIYRCGKTLCGDAQQQSLPLDTAALDGNTVKWTNAQPFGIGVWPPAKP